MVNGGDGLLIAKGGGVGAEVRARRGGGMPMGWIKSYIDDSYIDNVCKILTSDVSARICGDL